MTTHLLFRLRGTATLLSLTFVACSAPSQPLLPSVLWVWVPDSLATVAREGYSGFSSSSRFVVTDPASWARAWEQIYAYRATQPPLPAVDFGAFSVLVAAMGSRGSGGYSISVDSLEGTQAGAVAYLTERSPGPNCGVTAAITAPVHAVLTPAPVAVREWRVRQLVSDCT